jgi:uncharacterized protein (DUF488 family)
MGAYIGINGGEVKKPQDGQERSSGDRNERKACPVSFIETSPGYANVREHSHVTTIENAAAIMTVGYQGRDATELIAALCGARVEVLVDVRLTPLSRKPGLSKSRLAAALRDSGIEYVHLPQLGNPRDNRDGYRNAEAGALKRFRTILRSPDASSALQRLRQIAADNTVALLCFERDPRECHRNLIVEEMLPTLDERSAVLHL